MRISDRLEVPRGKSNLIKPFVSSLINTVSAAVYNSGQFKTTEFDYAVSITKMDTPSCGMTYRLIKSTELFRFLTDYLCFYLERGEVNTIDLDFAVWDYVRIYLKVNGEDRLKIHCIQPYSNWSEVIV